jgi:predicted nucleic acid-binding protein
MALAILDTTVYIQHWERGLHAEALDAVRRGFVVRHSAVVLSELRRGARTAQAEKRIGQLFRRLRDVWEPTSADWWEAGRLIRRIGDQQGWERVKRRAFQNDVLIGLTARRHGATVVTCNRRDFELLRRVLPIDVFSL